jgi:hypothetical protein
MATDGLDVDSNGVLENGGSYDNGVESRNGNAKDHGWKKVTNVKKQRRQEMKGSIATGQQELEKNGAKPAEPKGFQALETEAAERRKRREARIAAALAAGESGEEQGDVGGEHQPEEGTVAVGGELKKMKPKKSTKPKVTVADAAAAIDPSDLSTFLADITVSFLMSSTSTTYSICVLILEFGVQGLALQLGQSMAKCQNCSIAQCSEAPQLTNVHRN